MSDQEANATPKTRKPRSASKFIVLKEVAYPGDPTRILYEQATDGKTIKECRARVEKLKIVGKLTIACVRRVGETKLQETLDVEGLLTCRTSSNQS